MAEARRLSHALTRHLPAVAVLCAVALVWEFFTKITGEPAYILPPVSAIVRTCATLAADVLIPAAAVTLEEMLLGFVLGVGVGILLAVLLFQFALVRRSLLPIIIASQAIPVIAIAPIFILWFGFGVAPKVLMAALISFFPVVINTLAGLETVEADSVNLMRSLGASGRQIFWKLRLPSATPFMFAGIKNAAAISAIGAIVGEWVGASAGLGPVMIGANAAFKTATVFAAIFYLAAMAIALFLLVGLLEKRTIRWYYLTRK